MASYQAPYQGSYQGPNPVPYGPPQGPMVRSPSPVVPPLPTNVDFHGLSLGPKAATAAPRMPAAAGPPAGPNGYSTGLLSCMEDGGICVMGTLAPCYLAARVMKGARGESGCHVGWCLAGSVAAVCGWFCCCWIEAWVARSHVMDAYGIQQDTLPRVFVCLFCGPCMLCQDAREVNLRKLHSQLPSNIDDAAPLLPQRPA